MLRTKSTNKEAEATTKAPEAPDVYPNEPEALGVPDDHGLHVENETCARCGREIKASDEARKTAKGDCVHLSC